MAARRPAVGGQAARLAGPDGSPAPAAQADRWSPAARRRHQRRAHPGNLARSRASLHAPVPAC